MVLDGAVALVTGAGRGIGRALAQELGQAGASVVCADVRDDIARETAQGLEAAGIPALAQPLDVRSAASVQAAVAAALARFGRIDVLVNNAGIVTLAPLLELAESDWDRVFEVNVKGVFLMTQAVAQQMVKQGRGGRIINIASTAGKIGFPNQSHYCASKAAVINLTRVWAMELQRYGITVNAICPGAVDTELFESCVQWIAQREQLDPDQLRESWIRASLIGRLEQPGEIARVAVFLASPDGSIFNGTALNADGGQSPY